MDLQVGLCLERGYLLLGAEAQNIMYALKSDESNFRPGDSSLKVLVKQSN